MNYVGKPGLREKFMANRTWKNISPEDAERIRKHLLKEGAINAPVKNPFEKWRLKIYNCLFTYYTNGTIYRTPGKPKVEELDKYIDSIVSKHNKTDKAKFLIGLDETGKGEVFGNIILTGVLFPARISRKLSTITGTADTKKKHAFRYWDSIMNELQKFTCEGFSYISEEIIPPWIDKYNLNRLMDIFYHKILLRLLEKYEPKNLRIVVDDYGVGSRLKNYLNTLQQAGCNVIIEKRSEDKYIETKIASIVSKYSREKHIKGLLQDKNLFIDGSSMGTGNVGNAETKLWLEKWYRQHKNWPPFVRKSYKNIRKIEGTDKKLRKVNPENFDTIVPDTYKKLCAKGKKDIRVFSIICPKCHTDLKKIILKIPSREFLCPIKDCGYVIKNLEVCLYFYLGRIVITQDILTEVANLLDKLLFPIGFELLIHTNGNFLSENSSDRKAYELLRKFDNYKLIKLTHIRQSKISEICKKEDAILLTIDKKLAKELLGENLFVILLAD